MHKLIELEDNDAKTLNTLLTDQNENLNGPIGLPFTRIAEFD